MAHNTRIRADLAGGVNPWVLGSSALQAELQAFDDAQFKSLNGDGGGTWNPVAALTFGGAGLKLTGSATIADCRALTLESFSVLHGALLSLGCSWTFEPGSAWTVENDLTIQGSGQLVYRSGVPVTVRAQSAWTMNGRMVGTAAFTGLTVNVTDHSVITLTGGALNLTQGGLSTGYTAAATFSGATSFSATSTITLACLEDVSGSAATMRWRQANANDSDSSYDCAHDIYAASISATRTYTLLSTSGTLPIEGAIVRFIIAPTGAFALSFIREDGSIVAKLNDVNFGGFVHFIFRDGEWHTLAWNDP
jgi:hypothetical protein